MVNLIGHPPDVGNLHANFVDAAWFVFRSFEKAQEVAIVFKSRHRMHQDIAIFGAHIETGQEVDQGLF